MADTESARLATVLRKTAQAVEEGEIAGIFLVTAGAKTSTVFSVPPGGAGAMAMLGVVHMLTSQMEGAMMASSAPAEPEPEESPIVVPTVNPRSVLDSLRRKKA